MPQETSKDISVQADGVKIGWNIMATLAAMGFGMYVYFVVTPLKADIHSIKIDVTTMVSDDANLRDKIQNLANIVDDRIDKCETKDALMEQRLNSLERR